MDENILSKPEQFLLAVSANSNRERVVGMTKGNGKGGHGW